MTIHLSLVHDCRTASAPYLAIEEEQWNELVAAIASQNLTMLARLDDYYDGYFFSPSEIGQMAEELSRLIERSSLALSTRQVTEKMLGFSRRALDGNKGLLFCCD